MGKLNFLLLSLVVYCALTVVETHHEARALFVELGRAQQAERQLEVAFSRLQLEQVALAKGERVDEIARTTLGMQQPDPGKILFMTLDGRLLNE